ncbi:MAG: glycosyltransferase [Prochloraceae cyanobacterium]|nr:glycosyltransferase [Prochloraceae cyanobacterium]
MVQDIKISVITTFYNAEAYLRQAIESVFNQEYTNWELVLWDDGSTDGSEAIAREFLSQYPEKIYLAKDNTNKGRGNALYEAIEVSTGEVFCILDADDRLGTKALSLVNNVFINNPPNVGWLYTNYTECDKDGNQLRLGTKNNIIYSRLNELHTMCCFHLRAIRRSFYEETPKVNRTLTAAVDHDLNLKLSEQGKPIHIKKAVYKYRLHSNRISVEKKKEQGETFVACSEAAIKRRGWEGRYYLSHTEDYSSIQLCEKKYLREPLPQKVFCVGLGRTGTRSLTRAIQMLGYNTVKNPRDLNVLQYFDAASDVLIAASYQQLDETYPNSKFILTVRDIPSWLDSWEQHNTRSLSRFNNELPQWVKDFRIMLYSQWEFDRTVWQAKYNQHYNSARNYFSGNSNFIVFNIFEDDRWQKLTQFLALNSDLPLSVTETNKVTSNKFPAIKN